MKKTLSLIKRNILSFITYILSPIRRIGLKNRDFTIISNNCWAGFVYRRFNLPYQTPFLGLFLPAPCFIELLEDFENNMKKDLHFISVKESVYYAKINISGRVYPIGVLGKNIEIHFLHYKTPEEAKETWNRRKKRINPNNMLVKFAEMDCCNSELIKKFEKLPFKNKICFVVNDYDYLKSKNLIKYPNKNGYVEVVNDFKYMPKNIKDILNNLKSNKE